MSLEAHAYESVLEASRGLLLDVCSRLTSLDTNYVIVGGWVPVLRTVHERFRHDGTKDVDVLLNDNPALLESAVRALLEAGYLPSAKHPFQLLRTLQVKEVDSSEVQELVFNVDLMHPTEAAVKEEMFVDIMELNIYENYDPSKAMMKSIAFPSSTIVFEEHLLSRFRLAASKPFGGLKSIDIPLLDEVGFILSKCDSVRSSKRHRDAFDIYFVLSGDKGVQTASTLRAMGRKFPQVQAQLDILKKYLSESADTFDSNVFRYTKVLDLKPRASQFVAQALFQ